MTDNTIHPVKGQLRIVESNDEYQLVASDFTAALGLKCGNRAFLSCFPEIPIKYATLPAEDNQRAVLHRVIPEGSVEQFATAGVRPKWDLLRRWLWGEIFPAIKLARHDLHLLPDSSFPIIMYTDKGRPSLQSYYANPDKPVIGRYRSYIANGTEFYVIKLPEIDPENLMDHYPSSDFHNIE